MLADSTRPILNLLLIIRVEHEQGGHFARALQHYLRVIEPIAVQIEIKVEANQHSALLVVLFAFIDFEYVLIKLNKTVKRILAVYRNLAQAFD